MYGTISVKITAKFEAMAYLAHQCQQANSLINSTLYHVRMAHFDTCPNREFFDADGSYRSEFKTQFVKTKYAELCLAIKDNPHYKALGGQCAQQSLKSVAASFSSYNALLKLFWKGEVNKPKMPNYRTKGGLAPISFPAQALKFDLETGECKIPISRELSSDLKAQFDCNELKINGAYGLKPEQIVELRIIPKAGDFYAEYVYTHGNDGATCSLKLDPQQALSVDPGLGNWLACLSTRGRSFIIDGLKIKSINQNYNRRIANLKTSKPAKYWDLELARITEKRNRQVRDAINKAARFIVNYCIQHRLGTLVFGWNQGNKDGINIGKKNNQEFVQIPTAKLKNRIEQLCEEVGIQLIETEESYTSKSSFIDEDELPVYGGEKPANWKPSGRRITRGQYKSRTGLVINADLNGAGNILRKVAAQLGINLTESVRAVLNLPRRYDVFSNLRKSYRKRSEASLQSA